MTKSPDAFRTISEVAEWLAVPTHVLRFWESRFTQIKPTKRAGGRRYYRPSDMLLLGGIRHLLHEDGLTIRGVQKLLREEGIRHVAGFSRPLDFDDPCSADMAENEDTFEAPMAVDVEESAYDNVVRMQTPQAPAPVARAPEPAAAIHAADPAPGVAQIDLPADPVSGDDIPATGPSAAAIVHALRNNFTPAGDLGAIYARLSALRAQI
ncbi:MAG: MerR family transcriptional regulator [Paracoccaceae bacterium]